MDLVVPHLSATMETAKVLRWFKQAGERIRMGEPLVELETDKAAIEVEAPIDGRVEQIVAPEGTKLPVGASLAQLVADHDTSPASAGEPMTSSEVKRFEKAPAREPMAFPTLHNKHAIAASGSHKPAASPLARRLARELGVDVTTLLGTGPGGLIRKRDVLAAKDSHRSATKRTIAGTENLGQPPTGQQSSRMGEEQLSAMRAGIAKAVSTSRRTIPSFVLDRWVETSALRAAQGSLSSEVEGRIGIKISITDFLLLAMRDALRSNEVMLRRWHDFEGQSAWVASETIDIGLVVAVADGMMIPVLRDLDGRTLGEIVQLRHGAVLRARNGRLLAEDSLPASITLSNLGRSGVDRFEAIINPGQSSVIAVGREHEKVVVRGTSSTVAPGLNLTLSADHRVFDGVQAAAFLSSLADRIELGTWSLS